MTIRTSGAPAGDPPGRLATAEPDPTGGDRLDRRVVLVVSVLVLGGLMVVLDTTITNVAIGHLSQALAAPLPVIQWVITGYT
ncbi:MAG: hypothetical protein ACRDRL_03495, partial [Sciscionella sp.]